MNNLHLTLAALLLATSAHAQEASPTTPPVDPVMENISRLQNDWAHAKYELADKTAQLEAMRDVERKAHALGEQYPDRAEPKVWEGIALSTEAGIDGGLGALSKVKLAKTLLEKSLALNPTVLEGSAHATLGSLYYKVPGWPIGFGDNKKAEDELKAALAVAPGDIDDNYFYGDYLISVKRYGDAKTYLEKAQHAAPRPGRAVADAGRQQEIASALATVQSKLGK